MTFLPMEHVLECRLVSQPMNDLIETQWSLNWPILQTIPDNVSYNANYKTQYSDFCNGLIEKGNLDILKIILSKKSYCVLPQNLLELAANKGHLHILEYVLNDHSKRFFTTWRLRNCTLQFVPDTWNCQSLAEYTPTKIFEAAVDGGQIGILEWLKQQKCDFSGIICAIAAKYKNVKMLKWALEQGYELTSKVCEHAIRNEDDETLQLALTNKCPLDTQISYAAAETGQFSILKTLVVQGCPMDDNVCVLFARQGNLEMLQWATKCGCQLTGEVCVEAAKNGNFEMIKWAKENGCQLMSNVCVEAAKRDDFEIVKWAKKNGCGLDAELYKHAILWNRDDIVQWLHANGCRCNAPTYHFILFNTKNYINRKYEWLMNNARS
jgi:hypothetical protein